jgi:hypothetical protein
MEKDPRIEVEILTLIEKVESLSQEKRENAWHIVCNVSNSFDFIW